MDMMLGEEGELTTNVLIIFLLNIFTSHKTKGTHNEQLDNIFEI